MTRQNTPPARFTLLTLPVATLVAGLTGSEYILTQIGLVATYAIAGLGLYVITGLTGQLTLGHGAFIALGAYTATLLQIQGTPFILSALAAIIVSALGGFLASLPAQRLTGLQFGMSTLAFALITEEILTRWVSLTHGAAGLSVPLPGISITGIHPLLLQTLIALLALFVSFLLCQRYTHGSYGRAWRALRTDETAAQSCAINPIHARLHAFTLGSGLAGLAGALYAHQIGFISPEQFGLRLSFELLILIYVGGTHHPIGAIWGALIFIAIPQGFAILRDTFPIPFLHSASIEPLFLGILIVTIVSLRCKLAKRPPNVHSNP